jgi:hypothetical protein
VRLALLIVVLAGCAARSYRPTTTHVGAGGSTRASIETVDVLASGVGRGEITAEVRIRGDAVVRAVRLASDEDLPCGGGVLARGIVVDGRPGARIDIPIDGEVLVEARFAPPDLGARLHDKAFIDVDADDGCARVDLVRDDGTVEGVEAPDWTISASLDGFSTDAGPLRWGVLASLGVERNLRWLVIGAALRAGRADGRDPWDHVDLLGVAPVAGVRVADAGRWLVTAHAAYDLFVPSASSATDKEFLELIHGPRLTLRAGYGGAPAPWHAFRTRHAASLFGIELFGARWSESGWVVGAGLAFAVGR